MALNKQQRDNKRKIRNRYSLKKHKFQEKVKVITLADFSELIIGAGLQIIDTFGNYKLEDFNATSSDRLILICKK